MDQENAPYEGFHAGEWAWAIFQEIPGKQYQCCHLRIDVATRDGDKVSYQFKGLDKAIAANRVFRQAELAEQTCEKLNAHRG